MLEPPSAGVEARLEGLRLGGEGDEGQPQPQQPQPQPQLLVPGSTVPHHLDAAAAAASAAAAVCRDDDALASVPSSPPTPLPAVRHAWGAAEAGGFPVRDAHYKRLGKKAPGAESFYELKAFDFIQTPRGV